MLAWRKDCHLTDIKRHLTDTMRHLRGAKDAAASCSGAGARHAVVVDMMKMMKVSEACEALSVSTRTLYRLLADCDGAGAERHGRRLPTLIHDDALDALRAAQAARRARKKAGAVTGQAAIAAYNARRARRDVHSSPLHQ